MLSLGPLIHNAQTGFRKAISDSKFNLGSNGESLSPESRSSGPLGARVLCIRVTCLFEMSRFRAAADYNQPLRLPVHQPG